MGRQIKKVKSRSRRKIGNKIKNAAAARLERKDKRPERIIKAQTVATTTRVRKLNLFKSQVNEKHSRDQDSCLESNSVKRQVENDQEIADGMNKYRIYKESVWRELLKGLKCKICSQTNLVAKHLNENGFQCKVQIFCESCQLVNNECYSSPREKGVVEINERITNAFLDMGAGFSGIEKMGTELNMNVMSHTTFGKYVNIAYRNNLQLEEDVLNLSHEKVRQAHFELDPSFSEEIINVEVSFDGTWHTRGHISNQGIGIVIDFLTGLVLDYVILSKHCKACTSMEEKLKNTSDFNDWLEKHKESGVCEKNFDGSSGAMEAYAAEILWKRSIEKCKMRYTTVISDGDSKTFSHLQSLNVYPCFELKKQECTNHIGKRMYTSLKKVVQHCSSKGVRLGGLKHGSLTDEKMRRLQGYYTSAIKKNAPNVEEMQRAIFASIMHCSSTDGKPNHANCPTGPTSWCFWQRAVANNVEPAQHSKMKLYLRSDVVKEITPVYERLSNKKLLERCTQSGTQNANESLHNSIWLKCPKNKSTSYKKLKIATINAIAEFNMGVEIKTRMKNRLKSEEFSYKIAQKRDIASILRSQARSTEESRYARKVKKRQKTANEKERVAKEGPSYCPGMAS